MNTILIIILVITLVCIFILFILNILMKKVIVDVSKKVIYNASDIIPDEKTKKIVKGVFNILEGKDPEAEEENKDVKK